MSDQSAQQQQYVATYGVKQMRGGVLITEQMIINAKDLDQAYFMAGYHLKRGELLHSLEAIKWLLPTTK